MARPTSGVGHQPTLWLLFILRFRKCVKLKHLLIIFFILIIFTYLRLINHAPSEQHSNGKAPANKNSRILSPVEDHYRPNIPDKCDFAETENLLKYKPKKDPKMSADEDLRPQPSIARLRKLFSILISHEDKYRAALDYLGVFRFTDLINTLRPFANNTQRLQQIYCLFQRYITVSDNGHIDIQPEMITYLKKVSHYLSDGFNTEHPSWKKPLGEKPVIVLAANSRFYDTLQASMRTVNKYFMEHTIVIYDLGFDQNQLNMIKSNCPRCTTIPFPFDKLATVSPHVRNLPNFAWKPIIVQDAVRRYGTIIYGDTSVRYLTSDFDRIIIDNSIRGFSCRELPGHYLSCFTLSGTFAWFNETSATFDDVYIAEAGFVAVTDNFLSRLVLKTWVACALDAECISPSNSKTQCRRMGGPSGTHRYDQSAMVAVLSFYFFQSFRESDKSEPAPYDMFASIQQKVAEVRRFEGDNTYFTVRKHVNDNPNAPIANNKTA
ncbi:unnamed protein product [Adineta ricciae]|uniref:Uncharacterized protein n=1 Tax=Adineta ricciae TaxID=249248 RepID=A0A814RHM4_ADIRI|nr:unnamed protein product [Adineta ricciae]CAF1144338.1 unnamed protein product [Adineta ricciae]